MRSMSRTFAMLALVFAFAPASNSSVAQGATGTAGASATPKKAAKTPSPDEAELIWRDHLWIQAEIGIDEPVLQDVLSGDLLAVDSTGQTQTKAEYIASIVTGRVHWEHSDPDQYRIHIYGDMAVMVHRTAIQGSVDGHPVDGYSRATHMWHREHGVWRVVAQQITRIPPQTPPTQ